MHDPDLAPTSATPRLAWDIARCNGTKHEQCNDCYRRLAPVNNLYATYFAPPDFVGKCEFRIVE
jgi:hypothetical protein